MYISRQRVMSGQDKGRSLFVEHILKLIKVLGWQSGRSLRNGNPDCYNSEISHYLGSVFGGENVALRLYYYPLNSSFCLAQDGPGLRSPGLIIGPLFPSRHVERVYWRRATSCSDRENAGGIHFCDLSWREFIIFHTRLELSSRPQLSRFRRKAKLLTTLRHSRWKWVF